MEFITETTNVCSNNILTPLSCSNPSKPLRISNIPVGKWGVHQLQQRSREDSYQVKKIGHFSYFAVFDGHGGSKKLGPNHVGTYASNKLHEVLAHELSLINIADQEEVKNTIVISFQILDKQMYNTRKYGGSTCTCVLVDHKLNIVYQVNLGDSRSIIFTDTTIISSTDDHSPTNFDETNRIVGAGGFVLSGRVNGLLGVARSFGDFSYKRGKSDKYDAITGFVSVMPTIKITPLIKNSSIILASDAAFEHDIHTNESLVELYKNVKKGCEIGIDLYPLEYLMTAAYGMVKNIAKNTSDDTTIMLVDM